MKAWKSENNFDFVVVNALNTVVKSYEGEAVILLTDFCAQAPSNRALFARGINAQSTRKLQVQVFLAMLHSSMLSDFGSREEKQANCLLTK